MVGKDRRRYWERRREGKRRDEEIRSEGEEKGRV
jgi:hypothetical protein